MTAPARLPLARLRLPLLAARPPRPSSWFQAWLAHTLRHHIRLVGERLDRRALPGRHEGAARPPGTPAA